MGATRKFISLEDSITVASSSKSGTVKTGARNYLVRGGTVIMNDTNRVSIPEATARDVVKIKIKYDGDEFGNTTIDAYALKALLERPDFVPFPVWQNTELEYEFTHSPGAGTTNLTVPIRVSVILYVSEMTPDEVRKYQG